MVYSKRWAYVRDEEKLIVLCLVIVFKLFIKVSDSVMSNSEFNIGPIGHQSEANVYEIAYLYVTRLKYQSFCDTSDKYLHIAKYPLIT